MKKGFVNISLGLIYCSMGSSWPQSHDTVPLKFSLSIVFQKFTDMQTNIDCNESTLQPG
jgi:hypothetical protein